MKTKVSVYVVRVDGEPIESCPVVDGYTTIFPEISISDLPNHSVNLAYLTAHGWSIQDNLIKAYDQEARHMQFEMDRICGKIEEFEIEIGIKNVD